VDTTKGTFAKLTGSPSVGLTGSTFAKAGVSVSKFIPAPKGGTLAFNMQGGTSVGSMPQFAQYRLGGWNGVRGYRAFSDLGTGSSMLMATAEYRFPLPFAPKQGKAGKIAKNVKGVFFMDAGQVIGGGSVNQFFERSTLGASVGFGLRVNMPFVGLIRVDYGLPLISSMLGRMTPRVTVGFGEKF
jgi:outer membrane protein insertion porin family